MEMIRSVDQTNNNEMEMVGFDVQQPASGDEIEEIGVDVELLAGGDETDEMRVESNTELLLDESMRVQTWREHITMRGLVASMVIGMMFSIIAMKLNLTSGVIPNFSVSIALVTLLSVHGWTKVLQRAGFVFKPFTRQESTIIQTCTISCYSIAVHGGFSSYLLGLDRKTYEMSGVDVVGNNPNAVREPGFGWMAGFLFVACFAGLFILIPLRKIMIVDLKLTFPSGLATAVLINGFHTQGGKLAKKQVGSFARYFSINFLWSIFKWFVSGKENCGFAQFPTFGVQAWEQTFYFDFNMTYVAAGMICSHIVNLSLFLGAILSHGVIWPLIASHKGDWYLEESDLMKGLYGYKVILPIALVLGDGVYNFIKILVSSIINVVDKIKNHKHAMVGYEQGNLGEELEQKEIWMRDNIPIWIGIVGYVIFSSISVIVISQMFPQLKWFYIVVAYILAPPLAFGNAYVTGLTDMNIVQNYGNIALFALAALGGRENGVVAGLVGCGLVKSVLSVASTLMQDFKTAYHTSTSPRAMLLCQGIGTALGCITAPLSFFLFYKAFDVGNPHGEFKAPYALVYRDLAIVSIKGFSALPQHSLQFFFGLFAFAMGVNLARDLSPKKIGKWIPLPMVMAIPFRVGAYFTIDMCLGSLIVYVWHKLNPKRAEAMLLATATGLICGEGLWTFLASILAFAKVYPPVCMKFFVS